MTPVTHHEACERWQREIGQASVERDQLAALRRVRAVRSQDQVHRQLDEVRRAAECGENLLPPLIEAAVARVTLGEATNALAEVFGR